MEPIRIAQVVGKMVNGGVEAIVMNYYRHIDHSKIQFDFIVDEDSTYIPREEIENLGGRIYIVPPYQKLNKYIPALIKLFKENQYKIVHSHINTLSVFPLYAAKKAGVSVRIAHNHSTAAQGEWKKNILKYTLRPFAKVYATHYAACSRYAGEWLFGKKSMERGEVTIFNNAIDLDKFKYDENVRNEIRKELGIVDKFVVGHVGRFCYQKNQEFMIDVFEEVYKQNPNAVLMLVGDGPDRGKIEEKVKDLYLSDRVMFMGNRNDVNRLYQAMDVFVLPSRYEGLPVVGVEAQAAGLPCVLSNQMTSETKMTDNVIFLGTDYGVEKWAKTIENMGMLPRNTGACRDLFNNGFSIKERAYKLAQSYEANA